jgi:hypothetical protein
MPTATTETTYEVTDLATIFAVVGGVTTAAVQAVAGSGWLGMWRAGENGPAIPDPGTTLATRAIWGRFEVLHLAGARGVCDASAPPNRSGTVTIELRHQVGFDDLELARVVKLYREAFAAASAGNEIAYDVAAPSTPGTGADGWLIRRYVVPFQAVN